MPKFNGADLFDRLRAALRLEEKNPTVKKLRDVQSAPQRLAAALRRERPERGPATDRRQAIDLILGDRKSTRLNSSHGYISYAVFCLKKKKYNRDTTILRHALLIAPKCNIRNHSHRQCLSRKRSPLVVFHSVTQRHAFPLPIPIRVRP